MASTPKFHAKNLHYEKQEPAFLRRLRGEAIGVGGDADRLNVQHARPGKKPRLEMDADDDGPTVVYAGEAGVATGANGVGREEYEALTKVEVQAPEGGDAREDVASRERMVKERDKQRVADVGHVKKRKAGKAIGGQEEVHHADTEQAKRHEESGAHVITRAATIAATTTDGTKLKPSKKQKKVKLSFEEPDT